MNSTPSEISFERSYKGGGPDPVISGVSGVRTPNRFHPIYNWYIRRAHLLLNQTVLTWTWFMFEFLLAQTHFWRQQEKHRNVVVRSCLSPFFSPCRCWSFLDGMVGNGKRAPGCWGYLGDELHYPVLWGLFPVSTKIQLSNFLGAPGEDYFKGNPKSLNFYFLVIWWGKFHYNKPL